MTATKVRTFGLNAFGFLLVTLAAYFSTGLAMVYMLNRIRAAKAVALVILGTAYLVNGVYGYAWARKTDSLRRSVIYITTQIAIGAILLLWTTSAAMMFAIFPLIAQAVVLLPRRLMFAACALMWSCLVVPIAVFINWRPASVLGVYVLAGIVFVVAIAELAVKEQRAKKEVERLVGELKDANDRLREYADQVEELATLKERNRLAREIHDSLGHYLTVVIVQIEAAIALIESDRERSLDGLRKAQGLAQKGLAEVRQSVAALRASPAESSSLIESMRTLFEECRVSGVSTEFQLVGTPRNLSPSAELALYRAAQEALTNVRKHSQARTAKITLNYATEVVQLRIHDDGIGATEPKRGFGLMGMHERVQSLGGEVRIDTSANRGFTLEVGLPG